MKTAALDLARERQAHEAGARTCIEKVAPFDRKPFDGQTGAKSSARDVTLGAGNMTKVDILEVSQRLEC